MVGGSLIMELLIHDSILRSFKNEIIFNKKQKTKNPI